MRNSIRSRHACSVICLVLLSACAAQEAGKAPSGGVGPAVSRAAPGILYANGMLTEEGQARVNRAASAYSEGNEALAYSEFLAVAEQGHGESQFNLSMLERDGIDGAPNIPNAISWLQKSAGTGYSDALFYLAVRLFNGDGVPQDVPESVAHWRKCAALGDNRCAFNAAVVLGTGKGMPADRAAAMTLYAQAGSGLHAVIAAQAELGRMYLEDGKDRDVAKAIEWLEAAAEKDDAQSQHSLAVIYSTGAGGKVDKQRALALYKRAADQGQPQSLNNLAVLYRYGDGVARDQQRAAQMFERAHMGGNLDATVNLGDVVFKGWGTRADQTAAVQLYKGAADGGHSQARCRYAQALRHGDGVARNVASANRLKEQAKQAGHPCESDAPLGKFLKHDRIPGRG